MSNSKRSENDQYRMVQPRKPKRKSVQFGRVSFSDDPVTTKELKPCTRSAMVSSKQDTSCNPPSPPRRKLSDTARHPPSLPRRQLSSEIFDVDGPDSACSSSVVSMNCLLENLCSMGEDHEEEKEEEDEGRYRHGSQMESNVSYPYGTFSPSLSKRTPSYLVVSSSR